MFLYFLLFFLLKLFTVISSDILVMPINVLKSASAFYSEFCEKLSLLPLCSNKRSIVSSAWIDQCILAKKSFPFLQKQILIKEKWIKLTKKWLESTKIMLLKSLCQIIFRYLASLFLYYTLGDGCSPIPTCNYNVMSKGALLTDTKS